MSGPVELIIVRHGESVRNYSCDLARSGDSEMLERQMRDEQEETAWALTDVGHQQAKQAGEWIRRELGCEFAASYVSPFLRTVETANDLELGLEWPQDDRLREREWGDYCAPGFPSYTVANYLSDLAVCANLTWKTEYPGAESVMDMVPRVREFLIEALRKTPTGRIIMVTHGGTIRAMQVVLERLGANPADCVDRRLSNCCVVMYRLSSLDLDRMEWTGEVRTAHPALPGAPETAWAPVQGAADATS